MMTATRLLVGIALTLAVSQSAIAGGKNKSTNSKGNTQAIEITDYGFGVTMPVTSQAKGKGSPSAGNAGRAANAGRLSGKH